MSFNSKYSGQQVENLLDQIGNKVDKINGKGLSTEDFTTALKDKLSGLNNYDDAELSNAISSLQNQLNTLVSGNPSDAINSFNEIIAFLDGIKDSQDLSSIIASIEQQIADKMDKVTLSNVATSGSYNDLKDKPTIPSQVTEATVSGWGFTKNAGTYSKPSTGIPKTDLASAVQTSLGKADTALQKVKTINGQSIVGEGDIEIGGGDDTRYFANFTVEQIKNGAELFINITYETADLINAAKNNKIICIPYQDYQKGFIVASYKFSETYDEFFERYDYQFYLSIREDYIAYYSVLVYVGIESGYTIRGNGTKILGTATDSFSNTSQITLNDNTVYETEDIGYLEIYINDALTIGSTIRFLGTEETSLQFSSPVIWANGEFPTIEAGVFYELSLTTNFMGDFMAVLTPFKVVS